MSTSGPAPLVDRGGVWPAPYARQERAMLSAQLKNDRRHIPFVWYWRLLREEDEGGTAPDDVTFEARRIQRRYADPIGVHIYLDWSPEKKTKGHGTTQVAGTNLCRITRAECRRLGALLGTHDDAEGLLEDTERKDPIFIPRSQDIFRTRSDRYYEIVLLAPEWWGVTPIRSRWVGTASLLHEDSTLAAMNLPAPPTHAPVPTERLPWRA